MHVLIISQYYPPDIGGIATRVSNIAKGLRLNGCNVTVVTAVPHYPYGQIPKSYRLKPITVEYIDGVKVIRTFMPPIKSKGFFNRLLLMVTFAFTSLFAFPWVGKVDALWCSSWAPGLVYGRLERRPLAFSVDDLTIEDVTDLGLAKKDSLFIKFSEVIYRIFYVKANILMPISPGYIETISNKYCVSKNKIKVVRGGVDTSLFRPISVNKKSSKFIVMYAGVLGVGYNFDQILNAASALQSNKNVEFVLHGGGEVLQYLRQRIRELKLSNVIISSEILEDRQEVVSLLCSADVLILPMKDFGRPYLGIATKLYEYQAVGKPIICCGRVNGYPSKYVRETSSGIVVPIGNPEALAKAIIYLMENPEIARKMGENGRNHVVNEVSIEAIGLKTKQILETLIC